MSSNQSLVHCNEKDRHTLSIFKQGVIDPLNRLLTWSSEEDCCAWKGVQCDNTTGKVTKLDLKPQRYGYRQYQFQPLQGKINLSLLQLEFLNYLDLSWNDFEVIIIPPFHDHITSSLHYLDISYNNQDLYLDNLQWLSQLSSLKYLNLNFIDLHKETNWLQLVAMLPSLSELRLSICKLTNISPSQKYVNFTSLVTLDLSHNNFNSELPYWLFNLSSDISHLDLRESSLHGEIPSTLLNLRNMKYLDLSWNKLKGLIPYWLGQHENLQYLYLSGNLFSGSIPSTLGNLSSLIDLRMVNNSLSGALSDTIFSKLFNLKVLKLSSSTFAFDFDPEWIPPFQLRVLYLANTSQGPNFPSWIYTQKSLEALDISSSKISFLDEEKFWSFVAGIKDLCLSYNFISGDISKVTLNSLSLKLDHNNFTGGLPNMSENVSYVDVSHNSFSGSIPNGFQNWKYLYYVNLRNNKLTGKVPLDLSNMTRLEFMDVGKNEFSGTMPMTSPQTLQVMILRSNQFEGIIPQQLFNLSFLFHLDLAHNKLSGSIPQGIYNITTMAADDASKRGYASYSFNLFTKGQEYEYKYNGLSRTIDLSANNLSGEIPYEFFNLVKVQTLNLSHNNLIGTIPETIGDMKSLESLDLSNNKLFGKIPESLAVLSFLNYMNLSYNNFSGAIPLGTQLQSFDASSYIGNPELCGAPLTKNCSEENLENDKFHGGNNEDGDTLRESLYLGMGVGFAVGFWGVCGSLFFNRTLRHMYFRFLNHVAHRFHVVAALKFSNALAE
ncbi:receptor-like protein EIX1 [Gastrolobium bilobum]|uniref:receptor-like protein EIX1 n=1 Tax=Gastrolobium bilobum TaxID=150636 RepID=UPI002AB240FA|nr:receptor-like protein EIX1 [Gastrolobium bilobum]